MCNQVIKQTQGDKGDKGDIRWIDQNKTVFMLCRVF